jgi:G3E family GTPase
LLLYRIRNRQLCSDPIGKEGAVMRREIHIVTGFLGSGKTTLLVNLLKHQSSRKTAVLVNEFGEVGLDHYLLRTIGEVTRLISGGCMCCSVREDLVKELRDLLNKEQSGEIEEIERVIIETSGLADPAPIMFTIQHDPVLQHHFNIGHVIATIDAVNAQLHVASHGEALKQLAIADKIVVTKTDLVTSEEREQIASLIENINPTADILSSEYGQTDLDLLLAANTKDFVNSRISPQSIHADMKTDIESLSLSFKHSIDWNAFGLWLSMLLNAHGERVLRVKGILDVGESGPVLLNGVQHIIHRPEHLSEWPENSEGISRLVFIMKSIQPNQLLRSFNSFTGLAEREIQKSEPVHP